LLAHAAIDAAQLVDDEDLWILLPIRPGRRGRDDVDAMSRAGRRAHVAGDALDAALFIAIEPMDAAIVGRQVGSFLGKLLRHLGLEDVLDRRLDALAMAGR